MRVRAGEAAEIAAVADPALVTKKLVSAPCANDGDVAASETATAPAHMPRRVMVGREQVASKFLQFVFFAHATPARGMVGWRN